MNLRELNYIYNKVPDFNNLTNGIIIGLYMFYKDDKVQFLVETKYQSSNGEKIGLFGLDIQNHKIDTLTKEDYILYLHYINFVNEKKHYKEIEDYLNDNENHKQIVEYDNHFIVIKSNSNIPKYDSEAKMIFKENSTEIECNIAVLYCSPGITKSFAQIKKELLSKEKTIGLNYSTVIDISIKYNDNDYIEFGNIKNIQIDNENINYIIEPLEASLLSKELINDVTFNKVSMEEILTFMVNSTNTIQLGKVDNSHPKLRKFKYITTLNNFELEEDEIVIGDLILSKEVKNIDSKKFKNNSNKFIYISLYITAENISEAQKQAFLRIRNIVNFMELINKNSSFYELYDTQNDLNEWNIEKLFIDYKIGDSFYIFNIFDPSQYIYGSIKNLSIKNYGIFSEKTEIVKYINEMESLVYNYDDKVEKIYNAIYWLNKSLEEINIDINKCVLYLNIALEYCISGEKGIPFCNQYDDSKEILEKVEEYIAENFKDSVAAGDLKQKIKNISTSASVRNRFEDMLKRFNINYTKKQFDNYEKIRNARNDIIHNGHKVNILKHDIIDFYMFLSKVMFYKLMEVKNDSV